MEEKDLEGTWRGILGRLRNSEGPKLVSAIFARVLHGPQSFADAFFSCSRPPPDLPPQHSSPV